MTDKTETVLTNIFRGPVLMGCLTAGGALPLVFYFLLRMILSDEYSDFTGFVSTVALWMPIATVFFFVVGWGYSVLYYVRDPEKEFTFSGAKVLAARIISAISTLIIVLTLVSFGGYMYGTFTQDARSLQSLNSSMLARWFPTVRGAVASSAYASPELLDSIAHESVSEYVLRRVAKNRNLPPTTAAHLAHSTNTRIQSDVAQNPSVPTAILSELALNADDATAIKLAMNPSSDINLLSVLCDNKCDRAREAVAVHSKVTPGILSKLAKDPSEGVRRLVAINPLTAFDDLRMLAKDASAEVRFNVARNTNTPRDVLQILVNDQDERTRTSALGRL